MIKEYRTTSLSALGLLAVLGMISPASSQPVPGGNPNCSTNWVGGACGPNIDNGGSQAGVHIPLPCRGKHRDDEGCNCDHKS